MIQLGSTRGPALRARVAIMHKAGNCEEMASVMFEYLKGRTSERVHLVSIAEYGHTLVLLNGPSHWHSINQYIVDLGMEEEDDDPPLEDVLFCDQWVAQQLAGTSKVRERLGAFEFEGFLNAQPIADLGDVSRLTFVVKARAS